MTATLTADRFAEAAEILSLSDDYKVLRRFVPRDRYVEGDLPANAKLGVYVDVETTSLDKEAAEIIELAVLPFWFDPDRAQLIGLTPHNYCGFEEPKGEISAEISKVTGISADDVIGARIDDGKVNLLIEYAGLVLAHNAEYDRPILERRLPAFRDKHWACSQRQVDWPSYGAVGAKLGNILMTVCGEFYDAHRALDDCRVGVHVLAGRHACPTCEGTGTVFQTAGSQDGRFVSEKDVPCDACVEGERSPFTDLLRAARQATLRVWAIDSAFMTKDKLKARGYRWSDGTRGYKSWFKDVHTDADRDEELMYLRDVIGVRSPIVDRFTAKDRFSSRVA